MNPLDLLLEHSAADLASMIRFAWEGTFLMAGIPWFATLFGSDTILTTLFVLPFNPALELADVSFVQVLKLLAKLPQFCCGATRRGQIVDNQE